MRSVASRSYMYQADEFQMFLRSQDPFDKAVSASRTPTINEIAGVYSSLFSNYHKTSPADAETKLENYMDFFKGLLAKLKGLSNESKGAVNSFNAFSRNYWTMCESLQEFETNYVAQYFQNDYRQIFKSLNRETYVNPFEVLQNLLKVENQEVSAMVDALTVKRNYEGILKRLNGKLSSDQKDLAKLSNGKKTIGSFLSTKPKETFISNLNGQIDGTKTEIQSVELLLNIMTVRLLEFEMPSFLKSRADKYERSLRSFGRVTVSEFEEIIKACRNLAEA